MIYMLFFVLLVYFISKQKRIGRNEKNQAVIFDVLADEAISITYDIVCSVDNGGSETGGYHFNKCNLLVMKDALILLGFTESRRQKTYEQPIIFTTQILDYIKRFPFTKPQVPTRFNPNTWESEMRFDIDTTRWWIIKDEIQIFLKNVPNEVRIEVLELKFFKAWYRTV